MKFFSWSVFLAFIGLSSAANYLHGIDFIGGALMATVPVGFAVTVFIVEGLHARGRAGRMTYALAGVVGGGAGVASYLGLFGMAREHAVPLVPALLLPLAFDGVVLVASMGVRSFGRTEPAPAPVLPPVRTEPIIEPAAPAPNEPVRTEPADRTTIADRIILTFGTEPADWPQATELSEALGCSKSSASTARRKAAESLSTSS